MDKNFKVCKYQVLMGTHSLQVEVLMDASTFENHLASPGKFDPVSQCSNSTLSKFSKEILLHKHQKTLTRMCITTSKFPVKHWKLPIIRKMSK